MNLEKNQGPDLGDNQGTNGAYGGCPPDDDIAEFLAAGDGHLTLDEGANNPDEDIEAILFGAGKNDPPDEDSL